LGKKEKAKKDRKGKLSKKKQRRGKKGRISLKAGSLFSEGPKREVPAPRRGRHVGWIGIRRAGGSR